MFNTSIDPLPSASADTGSPNLRDILAGDCPRSRSTAIHERCAVHYPQLPGLFSSRTSLDGRRWRQHLLAVAAAGLDADRFPPRLQRLRRVLTKLEPPPLRSSRSQRRSPRPSRPTPGDGNGTRFAVAEAVEEIIGALIGTGIAIEKRLANRVVEPLGGMAYVRAVLAWQDDSLA